MTSQNTEEQSDEKRVRPICQEAGMIIRRGDFRLLEIDTLFLVFDTHAFAREFLVWHEKHVEACAADGDLDSEAAFRGNMADISQWLATGKANLGPIWPLAKRAIHPLARVSAKDLDEYIRSLMPLASPASEEAVPQFVLDLDDPTPTLYGTGRLAGAVRHTGPEILGILQTESQILDRLTRVVFSRGRCGIL